jgi:hypothetical protein
VAYKTLSGSAIGLDDEVFLVLSTGDVNNSEVVVRNGGGESEDGGGSLVEAGVLLIC